MTGFYIYYNFLNLPNVIYTEGDMGLYYAYLADGTKFAAASYAELYPVRYAGSLVYDDGSFESASFGGGRIVGTSTGSEVHYFQTDHLGSTRVVAKVTPTGRIDLDRKDYYPFGKEWTQAGMPTSGNRYTFSGKEQQQLRDQSIHYADFGARFYDPDTGIFLQQDPLLEKYYPIGQYNYCAGNPIIFVDFQGMDQVKVTVPAKTGGSQTIIVDSKAAKQFHAFAQAAYEKYGITVTSSFRSLTKQKKMQADWDAGRREGLKARPATTSAHSSGFALDFNVGLQLGINKGNSKTTKKELVKELTELAAEYGIQYGGNWVNPDIPHFYMDEKDFGYEDRQDAIEVNDRYSKEHSEIPMFIDRHGNERMQPDKNPYEVLREWMTINPSIKLTIQ